MSATGTVLTMQGGVPVLSPAADLPLVQPGDMAALVKRIATLEARQGNVALSGTLSLATLQIGTLDVSVSVPGLLSTDRVSVTPTAAVPTGLQLGAMRPSPTANGVLLVQAIATVKLGSGALPLAVTALR